MTHICVCRSSLPQHEEGMGLIEDNEINNNTLAGVWITTGKNLSAYPGHVTTITFRQLVSISFNVRGECRIFQGGDWVAESTRHAPQILEFNWNCYISSSSNAIK